MHTVYTTCTALPRSVKRSTVLAALRDHESMIALNPLVQESKLSKPIAKCSPEEYSAIWYAITDKVNYLPGGLISGKVTYYAAFHDLPDGLQTHCYAPLGVDIRERWSVGGNEPGEPISAPPFGIGAPQEGLYLREDIDMRCNMMTTNFVKKNLKNAHSTLVDRLVTLAHKYEGQKYNENLVAAAATAIVDGASRTSSIYQPSPPTKSPIAHPITYTTNHSTSQSPAAELETIKKYDYSYDNPLPHELDGSQHKQPVELE